MATSALFGMPGSGARRRAGLVSRRWLVAGIVLAVCLSGVSAGATAAATTAATSEPTSEPTSESTGETAESTTSTAPAPESAPVDPLPVPELTTATSSTTAMPDGSYRTQVHSEPVRYRTGDGWVPIDEALVPSDNAGYAAENAANTFEVRLPADAAARGVQLADDGRWLSMRMEGAAGAPQLAGNAATYRGVPEADAAVLEVTGAGVKESLVLEAAPAVDVAPAYRYLLTASTGLRPVLDAGSNTVRVVEDSGRTRFVLPAPFMYDAAQTSTGVPAPTEASTVSTAVEYSLASTDAGWLLTLTPDPAWLGAPERVWPVVVDPTAVVDTPDTDCWINEASKDTSNCSNASAYIRVGLDADGFKRRGIIDFDLPGDIPRTATVTDSTLRLYLDAQQTRTNASAAYVTRQVTRPWLGAVTWKQATSSQLWTTQGGDFINAGDPPLENMNGSNSGYKAFEVTNATGAWIATPSTNHGLIVKQRYDSVNNSLGFYSSSTNNPKKYWPELSISWTPAAGENFGDKIGDRKLFTFESQPLNDRLTAKVNVANGNLLLAGNDLAITGTGLSVGMTRYYNSLTDPSAVADTSKLPSGWSMAGGPSERLHFPQGGNNRVVFQHGSGYRVQFDRLTGGGYKVEEPGLDADLEYDAANNNYTLKWFSKEKWTFDSNGYLTAQKDKNGNTIEFTRDPDPANDGRLTKITDTRGRTVTFGYTGPGGLLSTITDVAGGRTLNYGYELVPGTTSYRLATTWMSSYTPNSSDKNLNRVTAYGYDTSNRLVTITDPRGGVTNIGYDATSRRVNTLTRTTPADTGVGDSTWTYTYQATLDDKCHDDAGNPSNGATKQTLVNGPRTDVTDTTTFCFDNHDRGVQTYDAKNHKRATKYGTNSNVVSFNESGVVSGSGPAFDYTYTNNNLTKITMPTGEATTAGTATAQYTDTTANPHLPTSIYNFDNPKSGTAAWAYDYDDDGNLIEAKAPGEPGSHFRYCYDGNGNMTRIDAPPVATTLDQNLDAPQTTCAVSATPQGTDTLLTYNTKGELTMVDEPGPRRTTTITYDALSRVKTVTDGRGVVSTYTYDAHDRLLAIGYDDPADVIVGVHTVLYEYDFNGNLTQRNDATNATNFTFDELNRMTKEDPEASVASTTTYTYDEASNMKTTTVTSEPGPVRYAYDKLNRTTQVTDQKDNTTTFGYDNQDRREATSYPNGVVMKSEFDDSGRLRCIYAYPGTPPTLGSDGCPAPSTSLVSLRKYTYTDPATGLDTTLRHSELNERNHQTSYVYDSIQRLNTATTTGNGGTAATNLRKYDYTIDGRGNITQKAVTGTQVANGTTTLAYADNNELCWTAPGTPTEGCSSPPTDATTYTYDGAGNQTGSTATTGTGIKTATYNLQGQTTQIIRPDTTTPFDMEYADVTSDRRTLAGDTRMAYSLLGLTAQGPNGGTTHTELFVRDPNTTLVSRIRAGNNDNRALHYIYDGLGSIVATTDETGAVVKRYDYDPYGAELNPTTTDTNPWRYAAGYHDSETGLTKFGTRYLDSTLMRWTQTDPVAGKPNQPMTLNRYNYVNCNPANRVDPTGRWGEDWWDDDVVEWDGWDEVRQFAGMAANCAVGAALVGNTLGSSAAIAGPYGYAGAAALGLAYGCTSALAFGEVTDVPVSIPGAP